MKRTVVQTECDVCGKTPALSTVQIRQSPSARARTLDLCRRHFRVVANGLKLTTTEEGKVRTEAEVNGKREPDETADADMAPETT